MGGPDVGGGHECVIMVLSVLCKDDYLLCF